MKAHIQLLETTPEYQQQLLIGLEYLLNISYVEEPEVFKVCLDYWYGHLTGCTRHIIGRETPRHHVISLECT